MQRFEVLQLEWLKKLIIRKSQIPLLRKGQILAIQTTNLKSQVQKTSNKQTSSNLRPKLISFMFF